MTSLAPHAAPLPRRTVLAGGLAAGLVGLAGPPADAAPRVRQTLARRLEVPWGLAFLPSGDALVGERDSGRVLRVSASGGRREVGEVPGVAAAGEGGLLGLAVARSFRRDRWLYAYLSTASDNRVVRMRYADGRLGRPRVVLAGIPVGTTHNGGRLRFGPHGHLFVSTGDTRDSSLAPRVRSLAGKILRLTPDGEVPAGNPFRRSPVWTVGHRNVEGLAFDPRGRLWATELGENTRDEVNRIRRGHDYGWPDVEGGDGPGGPYHDPFVTFSPTSSCSPSGLAVVRGRLWVGALAGEALFSVVANGSRARRTRRHLHGDLGRIRTVERAPDRSLWVTTSNRDGRGDPRRRDDRVVRIVV